MSSFRRRLAKVEEGAEQIQAQVELYRNRHLNRRLADVREGRFFPFDSVMAGLNTKRSRQCFIAALYALQPPYQETVSQALSQGGLHPAKWLFQYVIYVGFEHYHMGAPLRIPDQLCDWLLNFDPVGYGYESERRVSINALDLCYPCGICYPSLSPALKKEAGGYGWHEHPFVGKSCFDCSGDIRNGDRRDVHNPARGNNVGWRERCNGIDALELPEILRFEEWDWEAFIRGMYEGKED